MKPILEEPGSRKFLRVYEYYRELILSGRLAPGSRLPSIRRGAKELNFSRTTMESAYLLLAAEGYIEPRPQSGYYVTDFFSGSGKVSEVKKLEKPGEKAIRYDFASARVDRESFRFDLWRRYMRNALREDDRLLSYGEPQGERELREELSSYLSRNRNVLCDAENIVIGAGIQSLLQILCPMLGEKRTVWFSNPGFRQGRVVFENHGFPTADWEIGRGTCPETGSLCYITPSRMSGNGGVMPVGERMELIRDAAKKNVLLLEDDYNSEFGYYTRPVPSLQSLAGGAGVVYMGTFSRMLLPSIRLSCMVLPGDLLEKYRVTGDAYNQTASKAEQIALAQFIRDGHLESQIRKSRKLYTARAEELCREIRAVFGDLAEPEMGESGFFVSVRLSGKEPEEAAVKAREAGIAVRKGNPGSGEIFLSCAALPPEELPEALGLLKQAVFEASPQAEVPRRDRK